MYNFIIKISSNTYLSILLRTNTPKFYIPKTLPHPSTLTPKSRLVNHRDINIFYTSLKVMLKKVSVKHKKWYYEFGICDNSP